MCDSFREKVEQVLIQYGQAYLDEAEAYEKLYELFHTKSERKRVWKNGCVYDPVTGSYAITPDKEHPSGRIHLASELRG